MRFALDLYINQRPFAGTAPVHTEPHEFVVIRENTEGPYVGEGGVLAQGHAVRGRHAGLGEHPDGRRALHPLRVRAGRRSRDRKHLTLVHKTNVLTFAGGLWERTFNEVAAEYPAGGHGVQPRRRGLHLLRHRTRTATTSWSPTTCSATSSPTSAARCRAASAWRRRRNLNPARTGPSMFEPVHGRRPTSSARARPTRPRRSSSAALMLDFLGEGDAADRIRAACADACHRQHHRRSVTPSPSRVGN